MAPDSRLNWNVVLSVGFLRERKTREPGKKPSEQGREPATNSTQVWRRAICERDFNQGHNVETSLSALTSAPSQESVSKKIVPLQQISIFLFFFFRNFQTLLWVWIQWELVLLWVTFKSHFTLSSSNQGKTIWLYSQMTWIQGMCLLLFRLFKMHYPIFNKYLLPGRE